MRTHAGRHSFVFTGYEIHAVTLWTITGEQVSYHDPRGTFYEPAVNDEIPACFSVYQHRTGLGLICVGDYLTMNQAKLAVSRRKHWLKILKEVERG